MKVLMIDDDHDFAESLAEFLHMENIDVDLAHDGGSAIQAVRKQSYHCVILDIGLPDMSGTACASAILALRPGTPILLVTGYSAADVDQSVIETNAMEVLTKPLDLEGLLHRIKQPVN